MPNTIQWCQAVVSGAIREHYPNLSIGRYKESLKARILMFRWTTSRRGKIGLDYLTRHSFASDYSLLTLVFTPGHPLCGLGQLEFHPPRIF